VAHPYCARTRRTHPKGWGTHIMGHLKIIIASWRLFNSPPTSESLDH
jgi:hypothetical protein